MSLDEGPTIQVSVFRMKVHVANEVTSVKTCCIPFLSHPFVCSHSWQTAPICVATRVTICPPHF